MLEAMSHVHPEVDCQSHGRRPAALCCAHVAQGSGLGFYSAPSEELSRPQAWCAACDARLRRAGGWNEELFDQAGMSLACAECWDEARARNEDRNPFRRIFRSLMGR